MLARAMHPGYGATTQEHASCRVTLKQAPLQHSGTLAVRGCWARGSSDWAFLYGIHEPVHEVLGLAALIAFTVSIINLENQFTFCRILQRLAIAKRQTTSSSRARPWHIKHLPALTEPAGELRRQWREVSPHLKARSIEA